MLLALLPLGSVHANHGAEGTPENLQAQHITVVFDETTENTLISWENINTNGAELQGLFSATYNLYRSSNPIDASAIASLTPIAQIPACDSGSVGGNPFNCRGDAHPGHHVHLSGCTGRHQCVLFLSGSRRSSTTVLKRLS